MQLFARPVLVWLSAPLVLLLGVVAGIGSAAADQPPAVAPGQPPRIGGEATAVRPISFVVPGQVVMVDIATRTLIVERRDGRFVEVYLKNNAVIKMGNIRVRPRDITPGDKVVVVGRPRPRQGLDATIITLAPRADVSAVPK